MTSPRSLRSAAGALAAGAFLLIPAVPAHAETADLIDADPVEVVIESPAPGESRSFDLSVLSTTDTTVPIGLTVVDQSGALVAGPTPVEITLTDDAGQTVLESTRADDLLGRTLDLPDLSAGASYHLAGTVTLPVDAGNSYQGADGQIVFRFQASAEPPAGEPSAPALTEAVTSRLATTGATVLGAVVAGAVLLAAGWAMLATRRRRDTHA